MFILTYFFISIVFHLTGFILATIDLVLDQDEEEEGVLTFMMTAD